ncbi:MAG: hypothetical protein KIT77_06340 [Caldilinea sp.]|nr:hypothetical protein [Caldilineaceae bacterium]MCB9121246.1 hypothetical protein [Caldilineaceae bacterium]MCW5840850.1 hypothetical protein [Caldilinea sp.]
MTYLDRIRTSADPEALEQAYRSAVKSGEDAAFTGAVESAYAETPDNVLLGAWHYRLAYELAQPARRAIPWLAAIVLAAANGLIFWWLSAEQYMIRVDGGGHVPALLIVWAPIGAVFVMALLVAGGLHRPKLALLLGAIVVALGAYPLWARTLIGDTTLQRHYLDQMIPHLALLAWSTVGIFLLRGRADTPNRFAFLIKSLEIFIMAGLFAIAGGIFTAITAGLFEALAVTLPDLVLRLIVFGGVGLIPVLAVAVIYDPGAAPAEQSFDEGLSKVIATLMRVLLPLTLIVLVVYLGFIPFRFWEPFQNRDVLIIYNAMLFAVIALLVGATPIRPETLAPALRVWLRRGLIAVALLATVVSVYALAAIGYRTWEGGITLNRLAIIGWNVINIGILVGLLARQVKADGRTWATSMQAAYGVGMPLYVAWALFVVLAMPWLFR